MTVTYTGNLKLGLPTTGTESGTWGDVVNQQITTLVDQAISGTVSLTSMTNADYTLTNGNGNNPNEARYMALLVPSSLTLTAARNIIVPNTSKMYIVQNSTTGGFAVTVKTSAGSGISVPNGSRALLYCDGANVLDGTTYMSSLTLGSGLGVASGGTGSTTLTANNVLLGNGTSAVQVVAPSTSGNVLTSNGTTWQSTAQTYTGIKSNQYTTTGSTTFTIPTGISSLKVTIVGAGGGATTDSAGGGGGTAIKYLTGVTPGLTITVTVGAGGSTAGTAGGSSSISSGTQTLSTVTANGGSGAASSGTVGAGGTATGGDLNVTGETGLQALNSLTPTNLNRGGKSLFGLGNATGYGSGGAVTQAGANGLVFFEW